MSTFQIRTVEVNNFKSFDAAHIDLGKLNVIVGANASGKSNFVTIFKFLKDIANFGLEDAVVINGGVECIRNMSIGSSKDLRIYVNSVMSGKFPNYPIRLKGMPSLVNMDITEIAYEFLIKFFKKKSGYKVKRERMEAHFRITEIVRKKKERPAIGKSLIDGKFKLEINEQGMFSIQIEPDSLSIELGEIFPFMRMTKGIPRIPKIKYGPNLILFGPNLTEVAELRTMAFFSPMTVSLRNFLMKLGIYDIDPRLSKKATFVTEKPDLASDGGNLPIVLHNILRNRENRKRLSRIMNELLPFIEDISVEKLADRSFLTCLREKYCGSKYLPAPFISDGTLNLTALIIALFFEKNSIVIMEEPERNIHPRLILKVMDIIKEAASETGKQILLTTHHPTVVRGAGAEKLLLIHREGSFSHISKPSEKEKVIVFLKHEIGVDELFIKNLLGD
jgi:predicted ATPase